MKKIFCIVCCYLLSVPVLADYWRMGPSERCFVHANAKGAKDVFYYCGDQSKGCAGNNDASYDSRYWQGYGDKVEAGSGFGNHWCCDSKYIKATGDYANSFTKEETVTVTLKEGKCNYVKSIDACGKVTDVPCTEADPNSCADGYVSRENKCVKLCQDGYAFENEHSSECIKCDTTAYSGIVAGNCLKCDKDTEFYDKMNKNCISKTKMNKYSSEQMAKCFMCRSKDIFMKCLADKSTDDPNCPIE